MGLKTSFRWIGERIKGFDMYGKTITFTYKGQDQFKTFIGGIVSIILFFVAIIYGVNLLNVMVNRNDTNSTINTVIEDLSVDSEVLNLGESNFQLAIAARYDNQISITENNPYFRLTVTQYSISRNGNEVQTNSESINYST